MRARLSIVAALAVSLAMLGAGGVARADQTGLTCADPQPELGEWRSYGHDISNTRTQPLESSINAARATTLTAAHTHLFSGELVENTPVVADGCVFITTSHGGVYAFRADTLDEVWDSFLSGGQQTLLGGVIVGSPVVTPDGVVLVGVSRPGSPYVAALDETSGDILWMTTVSDIHNSFINASPVYWNGMVFMGVSGNEGDGVGGGVVDSRGSYAILDAGRDCQTSAVTVCSTDVAGAAGGSILASQYTITDEEWAQNYRGASVWCTAAIDDVEQYVYACGGNPASKTKESRYSNALLKIDVAKFRDPATGAAGGSVANPKFGAIVDAYKGETDQYYPGLDRQPVCQAFGDQLSVVWSQACLQLDLDFGASPNIWRATPGGTLMVGDLQKSGIYHTVYGDNMESAWSAFIGAPGAGYNAESGAFDSGHVFTIGTPQNTLFSLTAAAGKYEWAAPSGIGTNHYGPVSYANGVLYTVDGTGTLLAFDATNGVPVFASNINLSAGGDPTASPGNDPDNALANPGPLTSSGVAIARNTVYAVNGDSLVAYR